MPDRPQDVPSAGASRSAGAARSVGSRVADAARTRLVAGAGRVAAVAADRLPSTHVPASPVTQSAGEATAADVRAAYRLLLGREPDPAGATLYEDRLGSGALQVRDLAAEIMGSPEFADRWRDLVVATEPSTTAVDVDGFTIVVEDRDWAVGATIAREHDYEPDVSAHLRSVLVPGATMVDVGANVGWHALLGAAAVGPTGRVVAIEPNPANGRLLEQSRERNGFDHLDIVVGAISDEPGWLALRTDGSNGAAVPLGEVSATTAPQTCRYAVPAFRLDDLLADRGLLSQVAVLKVDVEGLETRVLRGAPKLLAESRPVIVFEWFPVLLADDGVAAGAPLELLRAAGYAIGIVGHPSDAAAGLTDEQIEAARVGAGRQMLDLVAIPS